MEGGTGDFFLSRVSYFAQRFISPSASTVQPWSWPRASRCLFLRIVTEMQFKRPGPSQVDDPLAWRLLSPSSPMTWRWILGGQLPSNSLKILLSLKLRCVLVAFYGSTSFPYNRVSGSCSGYPIINRIVFRSRVLTRLIIGSGSCWTRLRNRVSRVDMNPTREPELPSLIKPIRGISF
jgi:hypothetical protein